MPAVSSGAVLGPTSTLNRTIQAEGERQLVYGPGQKRVTRTLRWDQKKGKGRPLAGFKQLSDMHVVDEESPGRVEYFDKCAGGGLSSAYRPQEALTTHIGSEMLRELAAHKRGPATGVPLKFAISTGDNIDSNQLNELRWFIKVMNGEEVTPSSGSPDYQGFTREQFAEALDDETLQLAQETFKAHGSDVPWYAVLGNHDGLVQGRLKSNPEFQLIVSQGKKVFTSIDDYECPENPDDEAELLAAFRREYFANTRSVAADGDRKFLTKRAVIQEFIDSSGKPRGHGLAGAPKDPLKEVSGSEKAGYYAFDISAQLRGISLDTIAYDGSDKGTLDNEQWKWLERELRRNSKRYFVNGKLRKNPDATNKMFILFSHHSSKSLTRAAGPEAGAPYHCFQETSGPGCEGSEGLKKLLQRYPNVIAWVNGHEHNNAVRPFAAPRGTNAARSFWEINTAAHVDWPQQSRLIEVAWTPGDKADSVFVYTTTIDHGAGLTPDRATQSTPEYLASLARIEAYYDACVRPLQKKCEAAGGAGDQNTKLVLKAPFRIAR